MKKYKTKQGEIILDYLKNNSGKHISAQNIKEYFVKEDISVGLTTIYRHLSKLEKEGVIKKYLLDGKDSACFEYVDAENTCATSDCLHLKCEECEKLVHFDCSILKSASEHINEKHDFSLNPLKTVYYGICRDCKENKSMN